VSPSSDRLIVLGKTGSPWGVRGWIKVVSYTEQPEDILHYPAWHLQTGAAPQIVQVEAGRRYGKGVIVKLSGIDTPEKARTLAGCPVAVHRSALPAPAEDEYYWADLEGLTVKDPQGRCLGQVGWMIQTGSTDAMVVQDEKGRQTAIPWRLGTVITKVSLATGEIFVDWDPL